MYSGNQPAPEGGPSPIQQPTCHDDEEPAGDDYAVEDITELCQRSLIAAEGAAYIHLH